MEKKHNKKGKIIVVLTATESALLERIIKGGTHNARIITRARILLLSHQGKTNREIIDALGCAQFTVTDVRKRYHKRGSIEGALHDAPRSGQPKKITAKHEAFVVATACTDAPDGHNHWTLEALKKQLLQTYPKLKSVSHERVRHMLMQAELKPWREKNVVRAKAHA